MQDFEIIREKDVIEKSFEDYEAYMREYATHIGFASTGTYNHDTGIGKITSYRSAIMTHLVRKGYTRLNFCNGGDDDFMVVDHTGKEFGFFEDCLPTEASMQAAVSLSDLWERHD